MPVDYLWQNSQSKGPSEQLMAFLSGDDVQLDQELMPYDIEGTLAHVYGLHLIEVIDDSEYQAMHDALKQLQKDWQAGTFVLDQRYEDSHSAIEAYLQQKLGPVGLKVHTGRSRNDQVLTALRLYMRDQLQHIQQLTKTAAECSLDLAEAEINTPMPGHTHLQKAMPTTVGVWLAGFAEAMIDDLGLLAYLQDHFNCSPLGSAAGFGVPLPLSRAETAQYMGLARVQVNPVYVQNSRGKFELMLLQGLQQIMLNIQRLCWDISVFSTQEFGYMRLSTDFSTGSSIMPNKSNPDVVELMRGSMSLISGDITQLQSLLALPSGYQRDLQLSKAPVIRSTQLMIQILELLPGLLSALHFDHARMRAEITPDMMLTDQAITSAVASSNFREAYKQAKSAGNSSISWQESLQKRVSLGGAANPGLDVMRDRLNAQKIHSITKASS